jgi:hypothetical protein
MRNKFTPMDWLVLYYLIVVTMVSCCMICLGDDMIIRICGLVFLPFPVTIGYVHVKDKLSE